MKRAAVSFGLMVLVAGLMLTRSGASRAAATTPALVPADALLINAAGATFPYPIY